MTEETTNSSELETLLRELEELHKERAELQNYVKERFAREFAEIAAIESRIEEATRQLNAVDARMREADPQVFEDMASAVREIASKEAQVKFFVYNLDASRLKKSQTFRAHGLRVSVTRATIRREYRPELLLKHPELASMSADGDPVVVRSIDPVVLDRLIAEGKFDAAEADAFLLETKIRNPQVRIRTDSEADDDPEE